MAQFEVLRSEGVQMVHATLRNETIRSEAGALSYMRGDVALESRGPGAGGLFKAMASGESIYRSTYTGTGDVYLEPSFASFHVFSLGANGFWSAARIGRWMARSR